MSFLTDDGPPDMFSGGPLSDSPVGSMPEPSATHQTQARQNGFFDNLFQGYRSKPTLAKGASGDDVRELQEYLVEHNFSAPVSGQFDFQTEFALRSFQGSRNLPQTGVADTETWAALMGKRYREQGSGGGEAAGAIASSAGSALVDVLQSFGQRPANSQQLLDPNLTSGNQGTSASTIKWGQWAMIAGGVVVVGGVLAGVAYIATRD